MRHFSYIFIFCQILLLLSCRGKASFNPLFAEIEEAMDKKEIEKATLLLDSARAHISHTALNRAYCSLLQAELEDKKAQIGIEHDSLLNYALQVFDSRNTLPLRARAYFEKGRIWADVEFFKDALENYYAALDILDKYPNDKLLTKLYDDLGRVYTDQGYYKEALEMFEKAYVKDSLSNDGEMMIIALSNIIRTYFYMNDPENGKRVIEKAYGLLPQASDSILNKSDLDLLMSVYYMISDQSEEALHYITQSIDAHHSDSAIYHKYMVKGEIYTQLHRYDSARYFIEQGLKSDYLPTKVTAYYNLFELYENMGDYKQAVDALLLYDEGVDSINRRRNDIESKALMHKYNVEKAIIRVEARNKVTVIALVSIFTVIVLTSILLFIVRDRRRKIQTQIKEKKILENQTHILQKEKEIRGLQGKMHRLQAHIQKYEQRENELLQYEETIKTKEQELYGLKEKDIDNQCQQFKRSTIYQAIMELSRQKKEKSAQILTYTQQEELDKTIKKCFPRFIRELTDAFPTLTEDDMVVCCLFTLNLSTYEISLCFAVSGANTIKQRKHRIKIKMAEYPEHIFLQRVIFGDKK